MRQKLFGLLVSLAVALVATIAIVGVDPTSPSSHLETKLDLPQESPSGHAHRYDCQTQCTWAQDEETHQFLETDQDSTINSLEIKMLSTEGYGRLADLAFYYHLSPSESELLGNMSLMKACLPSSRVLIIYFYTEHPRNFRQLAFLQNLSVPHVILSNGWGNIWRKREEIHTINNPYLLRWYGSSQERSLETVFESSFHEKAYPLPLGLVSPSKLYQQVKPIVKLMMSSSSLPAHRNRTKTLLINFSTNPEKALHRQEPFDMFCNSSHSTFVGDQHDATCKSGGFYDRSTIKGRRRRYTANEWNDMAPNVYREWANHKYTVSPRGQQKDCHRFWEALYVGSVPIVLKKDGYYQDLLKYYFQLEEHEVPVLFVQRWRHVTPELLDKMWNERFAAMLQHPDWKFPSKYLTTDYTQEIIVKGIQEALESRNDTVAEQIRREIRGREEGLFEHRSRCYAPRSSDATA